MGMGLGEGWLCFDEKVTGDVEWETMGLRA